MELRQLRYFITVAKTLNFSEAARKLFITQGTLSQQIKQLEDEVDSQLFERTSHSVSLTEAGEELLPLAEKTIEASTLCRDRMIDLRGALAGTLKIGVTHSFSGLLTGTLKAFLKEHKGVKLSVFYKTSSELLEMLREKELDLVLCFKPIMEYDDIDSEILFKSRLSVVMRKEHPLAAQKSISIYDMDHQGVVIPSSGMQARKIFENYVGIDIRNLNVKVEMNDPDLIMDVVQGTNLVTIVSSLAAYYRTNLIAIPLEEGHEMLGCVHTLRQGYKKKSAEVFISMLRESANIERLRQEMESI